MIEVFTPLISTLRSWPRLRALRRMRPRVRAGLRMPVRS
jgi:hypothetical protein